MTSVILISGPTPTLLLLTMLAAGARADRVTTAECLTHVTEARVRLYPTDSKATALTMPYCGLTEMNNDTFTGLPNLESIYLSDNGIEKINLAVLNFSLLTVLRMDENKLRELPALSFPSLIWLSLINNQLTAINAGTFTACAKLQDIALNHNHIDYIDPSVFTPLTALEILYLDNNKISVIPDQMFARNGKLLWLTLHNNRITHLPPAFYSSLPNSGVRLHKFSFFDNPWHCPCLLELLADVKRGRVTMYHRQFYFNDVHYDGSRPECIYDKVHSCRRITPPGKPSYVV